MNDKPDNFRKPVWGIIVFISAIAALLSAGSFMQRQWGMTGLAATEIMLLAVSLLFAKLYGFDFKDVFRIKEAKSGQIAGVIVMWFAFFLISAVASNALYYFFPNAVQNTSNSMAAFMNTVSFPTIIIIAALLPAVCEEALCRGLIQYTFYKIRPFWRICAMSVIFGLLHANIYRFFPTAVLGAALSYIMMKTDNLALASLFHFINNFFACAASYLLSDTALGQQAGAAATITLLPWELLWCLRLYLRFLYISLRG